ncbi:DUF4381 domain-containing protein [Vibrio fluminensis]|uniref:DUF4381 domain-containing protein n=1 Tax=Vibrio fluminensis TaxID=2783614 RepID=UPI001887E8F8|nr:DUF4381 domain-containing protein [Vibrio fluminensis]
MSVEHTPPSTYILRELHDVAVPESISWMPQTIGWQMLALLVLLLLLMLMVKRARLWWVNRYRSEAINALEQLDINHATQPYQVFSVLKIVLVHLNARHRSLHDTAFLQVLDDLMPSERDFSASFPANWLASLNDPNSNLDAAEREILVTQAKRWVLQHSNADLIPQSNWASLLQRVGLKSRFEKLGDKR